MSSSETSERAALLVEIASLEAQISVLSSKQQPNANRPTKRARLSPSFGDEESIAEKLDALLSANDSALLAAHPPVAKNLEDDELNAEVLERAYELVGDNAAFTGIQFSSTHSELLSSEPTHQIRRHTLAGALPSTIVPLGFRVVLSVREPVFLEAPVPGGVDPGSDYVVERMEVEIWGGGTELQRSIEALDLEHNLNPPALFARLRQHSLLATERARVFDALRTRFPTLILRLNPSSNGKGKEEATADEDAAGEQNSSTLTFANAASSVSLQLTYALNSSPSHDALAPTLTLSPLLGPTTRASLQPLSLAVLEEVQPMFSRLLADGRAVEAVVGMMVQSVLGEEA